LTADALVVLHTAELVKEVYDLLPLLRDVMAWRNMSHQTLAMGQSIITWQFTRILQPFVDHHIPEMSDVMSASHAVITGSCALAMLLDPEYMPKDLNFIVAEAGFEMLEEFILDVLCYHCVQLGACHNYAFNGAVHQFARYWRKENIITVTQATWEGVFRVIASSPTTADMTIMTQGGLATFYSSWTLAGIALTNHTLSRHRPGQNVGCVERHRFNIRDCSRLVDEPCGVLCPAAWRYVTKVGTESLVLEWNTSYGIGELLSQSRTMWRLAIHCQNLKCPFNPTTNKALTPLPLVRMPADLAGIQVEEVQINSRVPVSVFVPPPPT
jgi:hypothetical protein